MYIQELKVTLSFEQHEINDIGFSLLHDLQNSVKTHYVNHEMSVFDDQTRQKQRLGKAIFGILGMSPQWDDQVDDMKKQIRKANGE